MRLSGRRAKVEEGESERGRPTLGEKGECRDVRLSPCLGDEFFPGVGGRRVAGDGEEETIPVDTVGDGAHECGIPPERKGEVGGYGRVPVEERRLRRGVAHLRLVFFKRERLGDAPPCPRDKFPRAHFQKILFFFVPHIRLLSADVTRSPTIFSFFIISHLPPCVKEEKEKETVGKRGGTT